MTIYYEIAFINFIDKYFFAFEVVGLVMYKMNYAFASIMPDELKSRVHELKNIVGTRSEDARFIKKLEEIYESFYNTFD